MISEKTQVLNFEYEADHGTDIDSVLNDLETEFADSDSKDGGLYLESSVGSSATMSYAYETNTPRRSIIQGRITGAAPIVTRIDNYLNNKLKDREL